MPSKVRTIPYRAGLSVKPNLISATGIVTFTDGVNEITPNQLQCEAYGHKYDNTTGTCYIFKYSPKLVKNVKNNDNTIRGRNNITTAATTTFILGQGNAAFNNTRNNMIVGNNNQISNDIHDTVLIGTRAEGTANNTLVLGGNASTDELAERQFITLMYGRQTTNNSTQSSYLNAITGDFFPIPENAACYFHAEVVALRVGGSAAAGAVGDFASWIERGVVINKSGTLSIARERDTIKSSGTVTNWLPTAAVASGNFKINTRGQTDMTLEWSISIRLTQMKTSVAL